MTDRRLHLRARCPLLRPGAGPLLLGTVLAGTQPAAAQECDGLTTGSLILSEQTALVFMAAFDGRRAYLDVAFLVRGEAGWNSQETTYQPWLRPKLPEPTGYLTPVGRHALTRGHADTPLVINPNTVPTLAIAA